MDLTSVFFGGFRADGRAERQGRSSVVSVVCSCKSWARSCGVEANTVSTSEDSVAVMRVGRAVCQAPWSRPTLSPLTDGLLGTVPGSCSQRGEINWTTSDTNKKDDLEGAGFSVFFFLFFCVFFCSCFCVCKQKKEEK